MNLSKAIHKVLIAGLLIVDLGFIGAFVATADLSRVTNNAIDIWFDQSDATLPAYRAEQEAFGQGSWIFVNLWTDGVENAERASLALTESFQALDGTVSVLSPHNIDVLQKDDEGIFFDVLTPDVSWKARNQWLSAHPIAGKILAQADAPNRVGFLLEENSGVDDGGNMRQSLLADIRMLVSQTPGISEFTVTGSAVLNAELNRLSWRDILILLPATGLLVMLVGLFLLRRNAQAFIAIFGVVILVMTSTMAAMLAMGTAFNMVTIALPGLLFTLGIASGLHVCQFVAENRCLSATALSTGLFRPLFVSHLTTALGFGLLVMISVMPVQNMALWGGMGVIWSGLHIALLLPVLLLRAKGELYLPEMGVRRWVPQLLHFSEKLVRRPVLLTLVFALLIAVMGTGISKLTFDSTYLNMVAQDEQMRQDYDRLAEHKLPGAQLSIMLTSDQSDGVVTPQLNNALRDLVIDLEAMDGVRKVIGAPQIYAETAPALRDDVPQAEYDANPLMLTDAYVFALTGGNREVSRYLNYDLNQFRLLVMFEYIPNSALRSLVENQITPAVQAHMSPIDGLKAEVSGINILWANMDDAIAIGQIKSLAILVAICFVLFLFSFGSLRIAVTATFVNLLPVATIAMALGFLGLPIDMAAVFILSLLMGIAIDDTSFYINSYVRKSASGLGLLEVLHEVAPAMIVTSGLITLGFLVLLASSFVPIQTFGVFTAIGVIFATFADIAILTLLLLPFHKKGLVHD